MNQWDEDGWCSDILGNGQAWGDMRGKVKTRKIGFVRDDVKKPSRKSPVKGRTEAPRSKRK